MDGLSAAVIKIAGVPVLLMALAAGSCRQPLPGAAPSLDRLAAEVVAALGRHDLARLRELALGEAEFREVVWPELPAARPGRNLTSGYLWADLRAKSDSGLRTVLAEHGGRRLRAVRVEFDGETTRHRTYIVRRHAAVVVVDANGRERRLRLFGSTIERDGGAKVFSYVID